MKIMREGKGIRYVSRKVLGCFKVKLRLQYTEGQWGTQRKVVVKVQILILYESVHFVDRRHEIYDSKSDKRGSYYVWKHILIVFTVISKTKDVSQKWNWIHPLLIT